MIDDLDESLRRLLIRELPIKNGEVQIEFDQPKREWSARLSRPTLNLFLYDLRENNTLRQPEWQIERNGDGTATKRRTPARIDLHYVITAWATEPADEHRLLARTLLALLRHATLPDEILVDSLQAQPTPIPLRVAQAEELTKPTDLWGVLDNELRPAISCLITLSLNPYQAVSGPVVRTRELRFHLDDASAPDRIWLVGGTVRGGTPTQVTLVETGARIAVEPNGTFVIGNLAAGDYTLEMIVAGRKPTQRKLIVPSPNYDLELEQEVPRKKN